MQPTINSKQEQLNQRIQASLHQAEAYTARLRTTYNRLTFGGLLSSAVTTLVAGGTAVQGSLVGLGLGGWQLGCILAALLGLTSTVCVGMGQQLKLGERLPQGQLCIGQLRALDVALAVEGRAWSEVAKEYEEILKQNAEVFD